MDKVPVWSVVRDKAQVSGGGGNMKRHLRIHSAVTHRKKAAVEMKKEQKSSVTLGKRNLDIKSRKECQYLFPHLFYEAGVHWSSSVGIQPATVLGQLPVSGAVAGQVLRQHLGKFSAFAWV